MIQEKLCPKSVAKDSGDMGLEETPIFENYEDNSIKGTPDELPEEWEPKPDLLTDIELNASILCNEVTYSLGGIFSGAIEMLMAIQLARKNKIPFLILINMKWSLLMVR